MIPASKRRWFDRWFTATARRRLRRAFGSLRVEGLEATRSLVQRGPVVFVANHTAWWDPLVALHLSNDLLEVDAYALMDARNLRRLRFLGLVGGFGFELQSRTDGARAIRYGASLLDRPRRAVWVFPQGAERPAHEPLVFAPGAARMAELGRNIRVVPVGLAYVHGSRERPELLVSLGPVLPAQDDRHQAVARQQAAVGEALRRVEAELSNPGRGDFELVWERAPGWIERWSQQVLDRFAGWVGAGLGEAQPPVLVEPKRPSSPSYLPRHQGTHERHGQHEVRQDHVEEPASG